MGHITKTLRILLDDVEQGKLLLPELQRDFVWKRNQVERLFDSLYRELPIGYMVIWEARGSNVQSKAFEKSGEVAKQRHYGSIQYLLDGQQRLTTIKLVKDGDERFPLFFSLDKERFRYCRNGKSSGYEIQMADVLSTEFEPLSVVEKHPDEKEVVLKKLQRLQKILDIPIALSNSRAAILRMRWNCLSV